MGQSRDRSTLALEERLASLALDRGFITPVQLRTALDFRDREGVSLSDSLLSHAFLTQGQIMRLMAEAEHPVAHPPIGRFAIRAEVGRGASAVVFDALDTARGDHLALTVSHPGPAADVDRSLLESAVAAKIPPHPGIVAVRETGEHDGRRFLVMDLVDGFHLDQWIRRG